MIHRPNRGRFAILFLALSCLLQAQPDLSGGAVPPRDPARAAAPPALNGISGGGTVDLGQKVVLTVLFSISDPEATFQWRKNGVALSGATESTYTIDAVTAADTGTYTVAVSNSSGTSIATTDVTVKAAAAPVVTVQPRAVTAFVGETVTFSLVATGSFPRTYQWRKDGGNLAGGTDATLTLTSITTASAGGYSVVVTNALGGATSASASLSVNAAIPPVISSSYPLDLTVVQGTSATLSASLSTGSSPLTYQWLKNGVAIAGATNSLLTFATATLADAGKYSFTVTNAAGAVTSREATLTVNAAIPPSIAAHPANQDLFAGQFLGLGVSLNGSSPFRYQWRKDGVDLAGATGGSLFVSSATAADSGSYVVVVTNVAGSVTSNAAIVTVSPPALPIITTQPVGENVAFSGSITLSVRVTGSPPFTFAWRKDGVPTTVGSTSNGSVTSSYYVSTATPAHAGVYTVVVTNSVGSVTSAPAVVNVTAGRLPVITTQPADQSVALGLSAGFGISVNSSGSGSSVSLQWLKNGVPIANATSSGYAINSVKDSDGGGYSVVITSQAGIVTSSVALLTVLPPAPPTVSSWPSHVTGATLGGTASFTVSAGGSPPFTYQWTKNGEPIPEAATGTLRIASLAVGDFTSYTVTVANEGGVVTSPDLRITAMAPQTAYGPLPAVPWIDTGRVGDVVYFLAAQPGRIERYDLATERWLPTMILGETQVPTAFTVAAEGIYVAYGRALVRRSLDLATETPVVNATANVTLMFTCGNYLYYNVPTSTVSPGYALVHRTTLQPGPTSSLAYSVGDSRQVAVAPSLGKVFARSVGGATLRMFSLGADGTFSGESSSYLSSALPVGSRCFIFSGEQLVADDSGTVYRTNDLTFAGSFGEGFLDVAFLADGTAVVLRGHQLSLARAGTFVEQGQATVARAGLRVFARGTDAHVFSGALSAGGPFTVAKVTAAEFKPRAVAAATGIPAGRYSIDDVFVGENNIVHLYSRTLRGLARWDPATRAYLPTLPLRGSPTQVWHQPGNRRALAYYSDGAVTEIPLTASGAERVIFPLSATASLLTDLDGLVSVNFVTTQATFGLRTLFGLSDGPRTLASTPSGLAWQGAPRRLYSAPTALFTGPLQYETVSPAGDFGNAVQLARNSGTVTTPIRFNADGSLFVSRNARVFNADLTQVGLIANDVSDAAWLGTTLYTIRERVAGSTELQMWSRGTYLLSGTRSLPGVPVRTFRLSDSRLLVVTKVQGVPSFTLLNADLTVVESAGIAELAGSYFGKLGANGTGGEIAFHLRADRTGVLLVHLPSPRAEMVATNAVLGADGAIFVNARDLSTGVARLVTGSLGPGGLVGSIPSLSLAFTATKSAAGSAPAGYYVAPALSGPNGSAYAIVGSDGRALLLAQSGASLDGGASVVDATGRLSVTTAAGAKFAVALTTAGGLTVAGQDAGFAATSFAGLRDGVLRTDRLANISTRGRAGAGDDLMIAGFVLSGTAPRPVLVRAIGPSLGAFGVSGVLADPRLELYSGSSRIAANDDWSAAGDLAGTTARLGGFPLAAGSSDAALLLTLNPGAYTAQVSGPEGSNGTALVEVYDAGPSAVPGGADRRLINIATRGRLAAGDDPLIAGIVVTGNAPKRLLVRAVGPGLASFGVTGVLADPILSIIGPSSAGSATLATNDDWSSPAGGAPVASEIAAAAVATGAFALPSGSRDACLLLTLAPGSYTVQVVGKNNGAGAVLIEVYEVAN